MSRVSVRSAQRASSQARERGRGERARRRNRSETSRVTGFQMGSGQAFSFVQKCYKSNTSLGHTLFQCAHFVANTIYFCHMLPHVLHVAIFCHMTVDCWESPHLRGDPACPDPVRKPSLERGYMHVYIYIYIYVCMYVCMYV